MNRKELLRNLRLLRGVIAEERRAAKALAVDEMLELTGRKEALFRAIQPLSDSVDFLTPEERQMAEAVYTENLRNAYFFWSALKWVRQSVEFIGDQISPESYEETGAKVKSRYSGALFSGRI